MSKLKFHVSELEVLTDETSWHNIINLRTVRTARKMKQCRQTKLINYMYKDHYLQFYCNGEYQKYRHLAEVIDTKLEEGISVNVLKFFDNQECILYKRTIPSNEVRFFYPDYHARTLTSMYNWQSTRAQALTFLEGVAIIDAIYKGKRYSNNNIYNMVCLVD